MRGDQHLEGMIGTGQRNRLGRRHVVDDALEQRRQILRLAFDLLQLVDGPAGAARRIEVMEIELVVIGFQRQEQIEDVFQRLFGLGVVTVDLVDDDDRLEAELQRLRQHEFGLRHHAFGRIDQQHDAIDHRQDALDLAAEIGMARRVDDIDADAVPLDAGAFGQDGDAALALQIVGVHGAVGHLLVLAHRTGLAQQRVHQRGLAMVDMGDDGNIADIHGGSQHSASGSVGGP